MTLKSKPIQVVLVDSHRLFLEALAYRIDAEPGLAVGGTATNADEAVQVTRKTEPDVAIFGRPTSGGCMVSAVEKVLAWRESIKVILLAEFISDGIVETAIRLRVQGLLEKSEPVDVIIKSIKLAAAGSLCFSYKVRCRFRDDPAHSRPVLKTRTRLSSITPRQLEVLKHLALGETVKEVANNMSLSTKSIDSHKYRLMQKLNIHDRVELARFAIREGLVAP